MGDNAVHSSFADGELALPEFLRDDFGAGLRVEEAMTDHLRDDFLGTPVVGLRSPFGALQGFGSLFEVKSPELEVTLAAQAELGGGAVDPFAAALTLDEHGQLMRDLVVLGNGEGSEFALDAFVQEFERNHGRPPEWMVCQKSN